MYRVFPFCIKILSLKWGVSALGMTSFGTSGFDYKSILNFESNLDLIYA